MVFSRRPPALFAVPLALLGAIWSPSCLTAAFPEAEHLEHFERHVRPILVEHCQGCHGEGKQWAGLRLDSRAGLLAVRSEERRVGKEGRSRWSPYH